MYSRDDDYDCRLLCKYCYNYGKVANSLAALKEALALIEALERKCPFDEDYKKTKKDIAAYIAKRGGK